MLNKPQGKFIPLSFTQIAIGLALLAALLLFGCPQYSVYTARKQGEAEKVRAEQNRQIKVTEAQAALEAAAKYAAADTVRAHGIARSNQIIGTSLKENELYLQYLWLQTLEHNKGDVIYIPTEANFPIMEAGRFAKTPKVSPEINQQDEKH